MTIQEIKEELKRENIGRVWELKTGRVWELEEPALNGVLIKSREEGYKQGYKDAAEQIFTDLREIITLFPNMADEPDIKVIFPESDKFKAIKKKYGVY